MGRFRVWGRVAHTSPGVFSVIVSGVPDDPTGEAQVLMEHAPSRDAARCLRNELMRRMGQKILESGGQVVDVLEDD